MNKHITSFLLAGMLVWSTGCTEPEPPKEISADSIKVEVLTAVNKALQEMKYNTEHVASKKVFCSLKIKGTWVSSKNVEINCRDAWASKVDIEVDRWIWYGTIHDVVYENWKLDVATGCIDWTTPIWLQLNNCPEMQPRTGLSATLGNWQNHSFLELPLPERSFFI